MPETTAPEAPKSQCPICDCGFSKPYNMKRHMLRFHGYIYEEYIQNNIHLNQNNNHLIQTNNHPIQTNSHPMQTNSHLNDINTAPNCCSKCKKAFCANWYLVKHMENCKGIKDRLSCEYCFLDFKHERSRFKHYKICLAKKEIDSKSLVPSSTNNPSNTSQKPISSSQVASTINNVGGNQNNTQNNIVNILTFPQAGDKNFDFMCDQITKATMKALLNTSSTPFIGFNNFVGKVMENPQNRIVHKTNPNSIYSKIHVGEGKWEFAHDDDVLPIITHHMTTAALSKVNEIKEDMKLVKELYLKLEPFKNHVTNVNEMDYESSEYRNILQRIKLILVNLTRKWIEEEKML